MRHTRVYIRILAMLLMTTVAVSCQEEELDSAQTYDEISLSANVVQQYESRANDNGFADGDRIGIFVVNYKNGNPCELSLTGNHADNVRFVYDAQTGKWTGAYKMYWKDKMTPIDAYGYYPFVEVLPSITAYKYSIQRNQREVVPDTEITGYEYSDFLWAKSGNVVPTTAPVVLRFKHIMAGVQVVLVEGKGFGTGEWLESDKQLLVESTKTGCGIDLSTGTVNVDPSSAVESIIPQGSGCDYRAVIAPQIIEDGASLFSIGIDGKTYKFKREGKMIYNPGKLHKFTIEVDKDITTGDYSLTLLDEVVLAWEGDKISHKGTAREYITVHVEEGEYIGDVIQRMGLEPSEIINMKLTGTLSDKNHFAYIRSNMPQLEAINMRDLKTKNQEMFYWEGDGTAGNGWGEHPVGRPRYDDDALPMKAFNNMNYLQVVIWPENLKGIGDEAFAGCNLRGSLILPEGVEHIGGASFYSYTTSKHPNSFTGEIYIPSSVKYIGSEAFSYLNFQGDLVLPAKMDFLGQYAFAGCKYLTGRIVIPDGLTEIDASWAPNMTGDVVVPQGVKKIQGIGGKITSLYIPEGVEEIGFEAFRGQTMLKGALNLPNSIKVIGNEAFNNTGLSHIKFPENLEYISQGAFSQNHYLQDTLKIPSSVIQIRTHAFSYCEKLTAVILPEKLEEIQASAFRDCRSLNYIRCLSKTPPVLAADAFSGVEKNNFTVVVPEGCVEAYRNADGWKEFKRISTYFNFVCRPMNAKLLNRGNTRKIILNADDNWSVTHCPQWATPSVTSGYKKTEFTVDIDELTRGAGNRSDSIVFTLTGKTDDDGNPVTCYYKIEQFDSEYNENSELLLQQATKGKGINIIFTGDGYDAEDIATGSFINDVNEGIEYFFAVEPYITYKEYFNVYVDFAMSYESGVCDNVDIWRETKFNTTYGAGNNGRLKVDFDAISSYIVNEVENSVVVREQDNNVLVICVLNSDAYEGLTQMDSGGSAIAAVPHSRYGYPNDYRGLIQHEACGHGFGKLGDEYIYHRNHIDNCPCTCCEHKDALLYGKFLGWYRNLSVSGKYSDIEWRHLIFDDRYQDIVDIYEGGHYHGDGVYRSELNSCMNDNVPYFSTISRQAIVERIKMLAGERFDFEEFVANDSREFGDKFLTRSGGGDTEEVMHSQPPVIKKGSLLDYIKK